MAQYTFSNSNIGLACEETGKFLLDAGVDHREVLRMKLTFEEVLLKYQERFGTEEVFKVKLTKRLSSIKVEIIVVADSFDVFGNEREEDDVLRALLSSIGLAPSWNYKHGKNYVVFISKTKPLSETTKMVAAILLAILTGVMINYLPDKIGSGINDYVLTPVSDAFMGLISAVAGPLIFLSVLGSICSMGNMETFGKIGSKTIKVILLYATVIAVFMTAFCCVFYPIQWGESKTAGFSQVLDMVYDIIPANLFEPFITGNTMQLIFISVMVGLAMLSLSSRVNAIFGLIEQLNSIVQTMMAGISYMLPILIFFLFAGMISNGNIQTLLSVWHMVLVILLIMWSYYVLNVIRIGIFKKLSPIVLFKKILPTFMICLTTASSSAAYSTNIRDSNVRLGIDSKLVGFGIPIGQVLFMPGVIAINLVMSAGFAESYGIPITLPWIFSAFLTCLLVSFAVPPIAGGTMLGLAVVFTQLGIPMEVMGIALAVNAMIDFPCTACDVTSWQLTLIDVADSLNMLDHEVLHTRED